MILKNKTKQKHLRQRCSGRQVGCPCTKQAGASETHEVFRKKREGREGGRKARQAGRLEMKQHSDTSHRPWSEPHDKGNRYTCFTDRFLLLLQNRSLGTRPDY